MISLSSISSAGQPINLQGAAWNVLVEYIPIIDDRLPALQIVLTGTCEANEKRFVDVEHKLGAVAADMGDRGDVPGKPYTSLLSGVGTSMEENSALNRTTEAMADPVKQVAVKVHQGR
jgi:hypothetical protein